MQISAGSCTVTNGSATVFASDQNDWSDAQSAVQYGTPVFFSLLGATEIPRQVTAVAAPGVSSSGFWELTLVTLWPNTTQVGALYMLHIDFTPVQQLPLFSPGDRQTAQMLSRAMMQIDSQIFSRRVALLADLTGTVSTTLANVTGLSFSLLPNLGYGFRFCLQYASGATGTGLKIGVFAPTSPTSFSATADIYGLAADGPSGAVFSGHLVNGDVVTSTGVVTANQVFPAIVIGSIINGVTAGNLQLQWASEDGAATVTPKAGSWGELWQLGV
jgi:hypothetical protein